MNKFLPIVPVLLITLFLTAQPVVAATITPQPTTPKYYGFWQKMTLKNLLQKQIETTSAVPTNTPTPTPKTTQTSTGKTPTSTPTPRTNPTATPTKAVTATPAPTTAVQAPATNDVTAYIMKEINDYRASQGLSSVQTSSETCNFAKTRAEEISTNFNHDGFNQRKENKTLPYASWTAITENIAMTSNYKDVVTMWKNSSGHAANMRANTPFVCVMQHGNYYAYEGMKP